MACVFERGRCMKATRKTLIIHTDDYQKSAESGKHGDHWARGVQELHGHQYPACHVESDYLQNLARRNVLSKEFQSIDTILD